MIIQVLVSLTHIKKIKDHLKNTNSKIPMDEKINK